MTDEYLLKQLTGSSGDKKPSSSGIPSSLFEIDLPKPVRKEADQKKKKVEDELNDYINRMSAQNNQKFRKQAQQFQQEKNLPASVIKQKREVEASLRRDVQSKPKPSDFSLQVIKKDNNKYMPTIVDPFAKEKPAKPKSDSTAIIKNDVTSKNKALQEKIERKSNFTSASSVKPAPSRPPPVPSKPQPKDSEVPSSKQVQTLQKKKERPSSSSSSGSSSSSSSSSSQSQAESQNWRKELEKITGYNPRSKKYRERDRMDIREVTRADVLFRQDHHSLMKGIEEEEEDLRREEAIKRHRMKHHHH